MRSKANTPISIKNWRPAGMSLLTHVLLVSIIVIWAFSRAQVAPQTEIRRAGITLTVQNEEKQTTQYLSESDVREPTDTAAETTLADPTAAPAPTLSASIRSRERPNFPGFLVDPQAMDANSMVSVPRHSNAGPPIELSEEDLKTIAADQKLLRNRAPQGDPTTISLFGSGELTGRSFVFVIDRSKSMGASGLDVLNGARIELASAINQLEPVHYFQIVGYHDRTVTLSKRQLLHATDSNKQLVPDFISNLLAFGPTHHENGLVAAVAFKPDIIVLMTDGGDPVLNEGQLKMINRLAPTGCEIHCIQFGIGALQQRTNFMTRLADQNSGTFRYVDVTKWNK